MTRLKTNDFIFSPKYKVLRHVSFWVLWVFGWTCFLTMLWPFFTDHLIRIALWIPVFTVFSYPISKIAIPKLLLKGKYLVFVGAIICWLAVGWYLTLYFLRYVSAPVLDRMHKPHGDDYAWQCFLCVMTTAACFSSLSLGKQWLLKQREFLQAQQEKMRAELQLLKAQVHPHFLFNTLNNIYSFSLDRSPKTPGLILKLSSLLSYMLYDCKAEEVRLEKEVEIMKNYIDLEKERYGDKIEISWNAEGDIRDNFISPLLMLPFLENAFKHGVSETRNHPFVDIHLSVSKRQLKFVVRNSTDGSQDQGNVKENIGLSNLRRQLELLYTDYELSVEQAESVFNAILKINLASHV
jgi:hypothetical protein